MPPKVRELITMLERAGFAVRSSKGSHRVYSHPAVVKTVTISGKSGDDAHRYQIKDVREALDSLKQK
jgi:predicted RNA binding protein YcfA (HicA-like mRNA interferase family)